MISSAAKNRVIHLRKDLLYKRRFTVHFVFTEVLVVKPDFSGNYTCVSDTRTATVLLVVTIREADTGPEGLKTVNTCPQMSLSVSLVMNLCVVLAWK